MSTWVCMQACVGIHIKRGIIVSPTSVERRIWTLNKYDDDDVTRTWYESIPICVGKEIMKNCKYLKLSVWI